MSHLIVLAIMFITAFGVRTACRPDDCDFGDTYHHVLKIGNHSCGCQPTTAGQVKFAGGKVLVCTGSEWKALQYERLGSQSNPGSSCKEIEKAEAHPHGKTPNGVYYITLGGRLGDNKDAFPVYCDMEAGGWTMAFKVVSGISKRVYETYTSDQTYNENVLAALDVTKTYLNHYKNRIILNWSKFDPSEARVVLYKGEHIVKELKFNATGSNKIDWFSRSRLKGSPWSDVTTQPQNFFSISGWHKRYFFINRNYGGCARDAGWMAITGIQCDWENHFRPSSNVQVILYSKLSTYTNWNIFANVDVADTLVMYVR